MIDGWTSGKFQMCGAKDTFGIIWQPEVCGAHLLRLSMRSEGRVVPQHGGGQSPLIGMYYPLPWLLGYQLNSLTWKQPAYASREDLTPTSDITQVTSCWGTHPHHFRPQWGVYWAYTIYQAPWQALLRHLINYDLIFTQCHGMSIIFPIFCTRTLKLKEVKCFEFCYTEQVTEAVFKPIYLNLKLMLITTPSSHWTEMIQV